jgi:hypothetical protein
MRQSIKRVCNEVHVVTLRGRETNEGTGDRSRQALPTRRPANGRWAKLQSDGNGQVALIGCLLVGHDLRRINQTIHHEPGQTRGSRGTGEAPETSSKRRKRFYVAVNLSNCNPYTVETTYVA